ncbi:MAG: hypothetical protein ACFHVJ_08655 [Aestuariibacter sp.]
MDNSQQHRNIKATSLMTAVVALFVFLSLVVGDGYSYDNDASAQRHSHADQMVYSGATAFRKERTKHSETIDWLENDLDNTALVTDLARLLNATVYSRTVFDSNRCWSKIFHPHSPRAPPLLHS